MSFVGFRRTSLYDISKTLRRLASSFALTTVRQPQADSEGQTSISSHADLSKLETIFSQSDATYRGRVASLRRPEGADPTDPKKKFTSCTPTSGRTAHAPYSTRASRTLLSPTPNAAPSTQTTPDQPFPAPYQHSHPPLPPRSPITNWILASSFRTNALLKMGDWLGYGSPKQVAGRRSKLIYTVCSEIALGPEKAFWYDTLSLPPSFQSWFTVTNMHVWLATVRLRSLPPSHGRPFVQALIDNFFFDVEDRLRAVLGKKAPERLVTRHMKIFREQWAGLGLACDVALISGDRDMASAMWRNLLGARGANGIAYPTLSTTFLDPSGSHSPISNTASDSSRQPSMKLEDSSSGGVTDFEGSEIDKYLMYPQLLLVLTSYLRRELVRLDHVTDTTILGGKGQGMRESVFGPEPGTDLAPSTVDLTEAFKFGSVRDAARKIGVELDDN